MPDDEAADRPGGLTSPNLSGGEEELIKMSYIPHILTFLPVLSPMFIPVGVSVVHAIRTRRPRFLCLRLPPPGNFGASNSIDGLQH